MRDRHARVAACALEACLVALAAGVSMADPLVEGSKLCLYPVQLPLAESDEGERRSILERKLSAALSAASFGLADPAAAEALRERVKRESGGFIDPATGERDAVRYLVYRQRLAAELRSQLGCDAQLYALVVPVRASFGAGVASWDGASEQVSSTVRIALSLLAGVPERGWVKALSLWLHAMDLEGNDLAFRSAGIETLVQFALLEDRDLLPEDRWFTDAARLDAAIESALGSSGASLRGLGTPARAEPVTQRRRGSR